MIQIQSTKRLLLTASIEIRALADKRALARKLFYELDPYLKDSQFSNLDATIRFTCELHPVIVTLKHLGFEEHPVEDNVYRRSDMSVRAMCPRPNWNPIIYIL
jgi:hypothetical protein